MNMADEYCKSQKELMEFFDDLNKLPKEYSWFVEKNVRELHSYLKTKIVKNNRRFKKK